MTSLRSPTSLLRIGAILVLFGTTTVVMLLPATSGCPPRRPGELDPLECAPSVFTPPRLIVFGVGLAIAVSLWAIAFFHDIDT